MLIAEILLCAGVALMSIGVILMAIDACFNMCSLILKFLALIFIGFGMVVMSSSLFVFVFTGNV